jgi:hypothetical protein
LGGFIVLVDIKGKSFRFCRFYTSLSLSLVVMLVLKLHILNVHNLIGMYLLGKHKSKEDA